TIEQSRWGSVHRNHRRLPAGAVRYEFFPRDWARHWVAIMKARAPCPRRLNPDHGRRRCTHTSTQSSRLTFGEVGRKAALALHQLSAGMRVLCAKACGDASATMMLRAIGVAVKLLERDRGDLPRNRRGR